MKKVVRMLGLCALVALAFTACKKNDTQKVTFTANVAQPVNDARTHAEYGRYLVWDDNDAIQIFNHAGNEMDFTAQTSTGLPGNATFTAATADEIEFVKDLENANFPYTAFYPNATIDENNKVNLVIPAEQVYVPQLSFANGLYPMVGWNNGTTQFDFVSNAGMLNVSFTKLNQDETVKVDRIVLTSNNTADDPDLLTGTMIYDKDGGNYQFVGDGNVVVLRAEEPVELSYTAATDFTFVLPEGALHSGFTIEVYLGEELLETYEAQPNPANVIEAQKYTKMTFVQLPKPPAPTK
jgi:hypothetical protein